MVLPNDEHCVLEANVPSQDDWQNKHGKPKAKVAPDVAPETLDVEENSDKYKVDHFELFSNLNLEWPPSLR